MSVKAHTERGCKAVMSEKRAGGRLKSITPLIFVCTAAPVRTRYTGFALVGRTGPGLSWVLYVAQALLLTAQRASEQLGETTRPRGARCIPQDAVLAPCLFA